MWKYGEKYKMTMTSTVSLYLNISRISQSPCKKRGHMLFSFYFTEKKREELRVQVTGSASAWGLWSNLGDIQYFLTFSPEVFTLIVFLKFYSKEHQGSKEVHGGQQVLSEAGTTLGIFKRSPWDPGFIRLLFINKNWARIYMKKVVIFLNLENHCYRLRKPLGKETSTWVS